MGKHTLKVAGASQFQPIFVIWGLGPTIVTSFHFSRDAEIQTFRKCGHICGPELAHGMSIRYF